MTRKQILSDIFKIVGWKPFIDLCCSVTGGNACAPLYYDAMSDALKQAKSIAGMDVIVNPVFDLCLEYFNLLIEAYNLDHNTRAIFVVPVRKKDAYFKLLSRDPRFDMVALYSIGAPIFTRANAKNPLEEKKRDAVKGSIEVISIWEMNRRGKSYANVRVD